MNLTSHDIDNITVLSLNGRFDAFTAAKADTWLKKFISDTAQPRLIVNLEEVSFVDSTALATLVQAMKKCREKDGDLYLCCLKQPVRMIFELTRLDRAFEIHPLEEQAVEAFQDGSPEA